MTLTPAMSTLTLTVRPAEYRTLRRGDRVIGTDLGDIPGGAVVATVAADRVAIERDAGLPSASLYADQHGTLTVERPAPKPKRRVTRRVYDGLTLVAGPEGDYPWRTLDGRHALSFESPGMYVCDGPHPVREDRGRGSYCWGNEEHDYAPEWCPLSDDAGTDMEAHANEPTLRAAAEHLAAVLRRRGLLDAANTPPGDPV